MPPIARLRSSRPWIALHGKKGRAVKLNFRLANQARVNFTIRQVAPVCRLAGKFAVGGHAGMNRVRFNGRIHRRMLPPGTYRLSARTRLGATVLRVTLVIVEAGAPSPTDLVAARRSNVCGSSARSLASGTLGTAALAGSGKRTEISRNQKNASGSTASSSSGATDENGKDERHASVLSAQTIAERATNPLVIVALAAALFLLGLAALPQAAIPDPRLTDVLARHRLEVALAGAAALAAAIVALALG